MHLSVNCSYMQTKNKKTSYDANVGHSRSGPRRFRHARAGSRRRTHSPEPCAWLAPCEGADVTSRVTTLIPGPTLMSACSSWCCSKCDNCEQTTELNIIVIAENLKWKNVLDLNKEKNRVMNMQQSWNIVLHKALNLPHFHNCNNELRSNVYIY